MNGNRFLLDTNAVVSLLNGLITDISQIRMAYKLKLPDAIIAATSIANNASLITADKGFDKVKQLTIVGF